jgi:hypothetical protein
MLIERDKSPAVCLKGYIGTAGGAEGMQQLCSADEVTWHHGEGLESVKDLSVRVLHPEILADRRERGFCFQVLKAKARPFVGALDPPVDPASLGNAGSLGAQTIQLSAESPNNQAIHFRHRTSS